MSLYVVERAAEGSEGEGVGAAEGVRVTRRLHRAFTTLRLAASKGYTHSAAEELRHRYRSLRHDLRNPIGTIRSAVSLMEDETLPAEVRFSARYRSMVVRNATSLDALIGAGLSDSATELATLAVQEVSLRDVALAVRRDMREEAESAGCVIEASPSLGAPALANVLTDSAAFELALRSVVSVALSRARRGATVTIALRGRAEGSAVVTVSYEEAGGSAGGRRREGAGADSLSFAETVLERVGGRVWREGDGTVLLEIQVAKPTSDDVISAEAGSGAEPGEREAKGAPSSPRPSLHAGDDLAGARQGDHL
jgi:light-regulated signal transduction histidine kinase (bacteriophytochrome)